MNECAQYKHINVYESQSCMYFTKDLFKNPANLDTHYRFQTNSVAHFDYVQHALIIYKQWTNVYNIT